MLLSNLELSARQFLTQEGEDELELESKAGRTASSPQTQAFYSKEVFGVTPSGLEGYVYRVIRDAVHVCRRRVNYCTRHLQVDQSTELLPTLHSLSHKRELSCAFDIVHMS